MLEMDAQEARGFLLSGSRTGKLAVVRRDGSPMVSPIWFVIDDDGSLLITTWHTSIKSRAIRRDARVSLCVDLDEPPYSYVRVDGTVELVDDEALVRRLAARIGGRYMGVDRAEEFGRRNGVPGELVARLRPDRIVGRGEVAGY
jgi:PPOX class probable F420-dependent enzyme